MLADVFPTGFFATQLAMVQPGLPVAVFGAGPVGLLAATLQYFREQLRFLWSIISLRGWNWQRVLVPFL